MRALGAKVRQVGEDFDAAKLEAKRFATAHGLTEAEDGRQPEFAEGAATIGVELLTHPEPLDALAIPLGNGALLTGIGRWVKAHSSRTLVIGVSAAGAPAMERSWRTGQNVELPRIETIADGIGVRVPIPEAVADMRGLVDDVLLVEDAAIIEAMRLAHRHVGVVLEPAGAAGLAVILAHRERFTGQTVGTIFCGGNLTPEQMRTWLS
jgi:threonine dehydratase